MSNIVTRSMAKQAREQEALQQVKVDLNRIRKNAFDTEFVIDALIEELHQYPELSKYRIPEAMYDEAHYEFPPDVWESITGLNKEQTEKFMKKVEKMDEKEKLRDGYYGGYFGGWIEYTPKYETKTYKGQKPEFDGKAEQFKGLDPLELLEEEEKFDEAIEKEEMVALHGAD